MKRGWIRSEIVRRGGEGSLRCRHHCPRKILIVHKAHGLGSFTMRISMLPMESGNVFNLQDFDYNEIKFKQRSFKNSIRVFFGLFDVDLLLIWMNNFSMVSASALHFS